MQLFYLCMGDRGTFGLEARSAFSFFSLAYQYMEISQALGSNMTDTTRFHLKTAAVCGKPANLDFFIILQ